MFRDVEWMRAWVNLPATFLLHQNACVVYLFASATEARCQILLLCICLYQSEAAKLYFRSVEKICDSLSQGKCVFLGENNLEKSLNFHQTHSRVDLSVKIWRTSNPPNSKIWVTTIIIIWSQQIDIHCRISCIHNTPMIWALWG